MGVNIKAHFGGVKSRKPLREIEKYARVLFRHRTLQLSSAKESWRRKIERFSEDLLLHKNTSAERDVNVFHLIVR